MERNQAEYNIHDYVQNNKKSFEQQEFNNVDGVVMTQIANMNLDSIGIDINSNKSLSVKELYEKMRFSSQYIGMSKDNKELLKEMAESPRYREMIVSNYVNNPVKNGIEGFESIGMDEYSEQFAAVTISYKQNGKTIHYMSFRATDGSNDGWNEDLLMIYSKKTQAQADSVAYMNIVGKQLVGDLIGGGHSKGGNDFEYGYLYCDDEVRKRIKVGYLYDSPGLQPEIIHDNKNYLELQKILEGHFICPQDSIVGQLLHENDNAIFVNSVEKGFNEHDPYSWQIDPQTEMFVETQQSELSKYINRVLDKAVENMSVKEREALFTYVSYILYNGSDIEGIEGLADLFVYEWKNNEGKINYKKIANIGKVLINDWINLSPTQQNN